MDRRAGAPLAERLAERAAARPHDTAFRIFAREDRPATELTWGALWCDALATARTIGAGARIGVACEDRRDYIVGLAACLASGAVAVPMPVALSRRSAPRLRAIAAAGRLDAVLASQGSEVAEWLQRADVEAADVLTVLRDCARSETPDRRPSAPGRDDIALIQFTSGSTGEPAGVALTQANLAANCAAMTASYTLTEESHALSWLPMHHDMGLIGHVLLPMWLGFRSTLMDPLRFLQRPLSWLRLVTTEGARSTSAPNFALASCVKAAAREPIDDIDLGSLTTLVCGGEPVLEPTVTAFLETFGRVGLSASALAPSYGLAEATLLVSSGRTPTGPRFVESPAPAHATSSPSGRIADLGPPAGDLRVRIRDDDGRDVPDGTIGEIVIDGGSIGRRLLPDGSIAPQDELNTGDLGFLRDGHVHVAGRKSDLIILRGQNVHPSEIEAALPQVSPVLAPGGMAAVGIAAEGTQQLVVMLELDRHVRLADQEREALRRTAGDAVARATGYVPADVRIVAFGALPRTSSGKVRRGAAAALYCEGEAAKIGAPTADSDGGGV